MSKNTLKLTQGALITAVFGVLMFLNRQTGGIAQEILVYIFPIPMAVYAAKYGFAAGLPALAAMCLISFLLGTPTSAIYLGMYVIIGLVFGTCLHKKADSAKTVLSVMTAAIVTNVIDLIFLASLAGVSFNAQVAEYQKLISDTFTKAGVQFPEELLSFEYLGKLLIISMVAIGALQGFLIYELGLMIMKKLKQNVPAPKGLFEIHPPVKAGYAAAAAFLLYNFSFALTQQNNILGTVIMVLGLFGYLFLLFFGFTGANLIFRGLFKGKKALASIVSMLLTFILAVPMAVLGLLYISNPEVYRELLKKTGGL